MACPTYNVTYHCSNCGRYNRISFPIGTKAPSLMVCPTCGVTAANKTL